MGLVLLTVTARVLSLPLEPTVAYSDITLVNYALTLEHLEAAFYAEALRNFSQADFAAAGYGAEFYANLEWIAFEEAFHVIELIETLEQNNGVPVAVCNYSFPVKTIKQFISLAAILEGVGVSAYVNAAQYIHNKTILTGAVSVTAIEAEHNAYFRNLIGELPAAHVFAIPLDFDNVLTLASAFITGCPSTNPPLPFTTFSSLQVLNATKPLRGGDDIYLITDGLVLPKKLYAAWYNFPFIMYTDVTLSTNREAAWTTVPDAGNGQVYNQGQAYVVLTTSNDEVSANNIVAGPAIVEVGDYAGEFGKLIQDTPPFQFVS